MRSCLSDDEILRFAAGGTAAIERGPMHEHLGSCSRCRVLAAQTRKAMARTTSPTEPGASPAPMGAGARVGRYELRGLLGAGAAGLVYEAYDPQLSRRVALKILRPADRNGDPGADVQRLLREARAMAQLSHPAVVAAFDAGTFDDGVFIAMELIEGQTLARWLQEAPRSWREVVAQFVAAGHGLVAAHAAGLVHRDFKPENVLVGRDGRPRVTDFGLARASAGDDADGRGAGDDDITERVRAVRSVLLTLTEAAAFAGTPIYMSPEQFRGARADEATDQFNFCASLYLALYAQHPFAHDEARGLPALADAVLAGRLRPAPTRTDVPESVFRILARGLAADRAARFASMSELLGALERACASRRRWPLAARFAAAASAAGAIAFAVTAGVRARDDEQASPVRAAPPIVTASDAPAPVAAPAEAVPAPAEPTPTVRERPAAGPARASRKRPRHQAAREPSQPKPALLDDIKDPYAR